MDFSPSVYEHAARVIGRTPWEVSRDSDLLFEAHRETCRLYRHAPIAVGIDIYNLEAEAYGASVDNPSGAGIPAISRHVCSTAAEIAQLAAFDPERSGRIPMVIQVGVRLAHTLPETDVRIPVSGPFSLASNLMGFENLLCDILTDPDAVAGALRYLIRGQIAFSEEIVRQGLDIAFFESAATPPLISPQTFRDIELPALKAMIEGAASAVGHPVPCIIGGDTDPILDAILETGTGYVICPAETDQWRFMKKMAAHPGVMVRINMRPETLTSGDLEVVYREADRVLELAEGREKVCIGTGALPYEVDPDIVLKARAYVQRK